MKNLIPLFLAVCIGTPLFAQVSLSKTNINIGEVALLNEDVVDLMLSNLTNEPVFILRIETEKRVSVKYTSKSLSSNSTETLRLKLNPEKKGKNKHTVRLFLSSNNEPLEVTILSEVKDIPKNNRQACPDFRNLTRSSIQQKQSVGKINAFPIQLYNDETSQDLLLAEKTNPEKEKVEQTPEPITSQTRPAKEKKQRKTPEERRNSPSVLTILFGNENDSTTTEEPTKQIEQPDEETATTPDVTQKNTELAEEAKNPNLFDDSYKPNNIIFLLDASTSMRQDEKMDILKAAMIELLAPLRSIDYLSIVTYSGEASVVLPPTSGIDKEKIEASINNILADGGTHALKGIKKAIQVGKSNFIENGNNQIFLASDGAFSIGRSQAVRRKLENTADEGLKITVLGIKNEKWTDKSLKEIAELGQGSLIKIKSMKDASKVLEEVKEQASK